MKEKDKYYDSFSSFIFLIIFYNIVFIENSFTRLNNKNINSKFIFCLSSFDCDFNFFLEND